jgi:beta-glucosidase
MPKAIFQFPRGFLWGTATSSHQVEGSNFNNNWASWEAQEGRIIGGHRSGLACDWWGGRWREDFDRAKESGQNAHRFSVEWSRIQPAPGRWDEDALEFYRRMARGLVERGLLPLVTLHHFSDPLWLTERHGWENGETASLFQTFTEKVVEALKEYTNYWVTINEPIVYVLGGYISGDFPPGKRDRKLAFRVMGNMVKAHGLAYHAIHRIQPHARVGVAHHYRGFEPARPWFPPDRWMADLAATNSNDAFPRALVDGKLSFYFLNRYIPEAAGTQDFFGLNYYTGEQVQFAPFTGGDLPASRFYPAGSELSTTGFLANRPEVFWRALKWANHYGLPILITENGWEDHEDRTRPNYLARHLHQVWRAVNFNWPIKGYFHWSLVDNFEWERGWTQRFGLWGLDTETQKRIRRPSVDLYQAICTRNGIDSEDVKKYAPAVFPLLYPG